MASSPASPFRRRGLVAGLATCLALVACQGPPGSGGSAGGPYDDLTVDQRLDGDGLSAPVHVVIDGHGIPHIHGKTLEDAAYANGYVMARDRWAQLEIFRHVAAGRIGEIFGGLDPAQLDEDLRMRAFRMRPLAAETWAILQASADPIDREMVATLERYADGVNRYLAQLADGTMALQEDVDLLLPDPENIEPWTPVDSLTIGRLLTYTLSFNDYELGVSEALDAARARFDAADAKTAPDLRRRAGTYFDLFDVRPLDATSTIDGFPNVDVDTGSRAGLARAGTGRRATSPAGLIGRARAAMAPPRIFGGASARGGIGSNNWVVGPALAGGTTLLANDPHLPLSNPPFWYLLHVTVPGALDVEGAGFPGVPGVLLGHNEHFAWGATVVFHDANDYYLEELVPCATGGGTCSVFNGGEVPLETWTETITIGTLGIEQGTIEATYQRVPHHGTLIPNVVDREVVEHGPGQALSVRYTGGVPTFEVRAFHKMARAQTRAEGFVAMSDLGHGAMNWVMVDDQGDFGWTSIADIPVRSLGCYGFSSENPDGAAPFLVAPGDGSCEWEGFMDPRYIPHAIAPEKGYLATANADPVGQTFDGDPLNGPIVDGRPLYVGATYDVGYRVGRITRLLEQRKATGTAMTLEDMSQIQADTHSSYGETLRPAVLAALDALAVELATPGTHPDLAAYALALPAGDRASIADVRARLAAWTLATPTGEEGADAATIADSVATTLFNAWTVRFLTGAFADELAVLDAGVDEQITTRTAWKVLVRTDLLHGQIAPETGQSILCDDLATPETIESCTLIAVRAARDAVAFARERFGSADPSTWRWGALHTVSVEPLTPQDALRLPIEGGFPRPGDMHAVDVANHGAQNDNYTYAFGPSMRHVTQFADGGSTTWMQLPGGQVFDPDSPHYGDLMELWRRNESFVFPFTPAEVRADAETHLVVE